MPRLRKPKQQQEAPEERTLPEHKTLEDGSLEVDLSAEPKVKAEGGEVELKPEPVVVVHDLEQKDGEDDEKLVLRKRVEELEQAEKAAHGAQRAAIEAERRSRDEAVRRAETETKRYQEDAAQAQYDSVVNALGAAQAEAEAAQRDIEVASEAGNYKLQGEAHRRMGLATAKIVQLEDAKASLDMRRETERTRPAPSQTQADPLEASIAHLPETGKAWVRQHADWWTDPRKNAKLQAYHWDALDAGNAAFSAGYIDFLDHATGIKQKPKTEAEERTEAQPQRTVVSAPVSRDTPSLDTGKPKSSSKITLTPHQVEAARLSGVDPQEYAKQLLKLQELKKAGHYQ